MALNFYHIILNEQAGGTTAKKVWPELEVILKNQHINYRLYKSEYHGHSTVLAQKIARRMATSTKHAVLVIGGDGTLHEVINGLYYAPSNLPIGYIACGSGNDFARGAHYPKKPRIMLEQILAMDEPTLLDIGVYQNLIKREKGVFVNNLGIGFDANIVATANGSKLKKPLNHLGLGTLSYAAAIFQVFARQKPFEMRIKTPKEQQSFPHAFLVTTTNHPYFGGGIAIMPSAVMDDHLLDLVIVERPSLIKFLYLFVLVLLGKHTGHPDVHHFVAEEIHLSSPSIEFGQADGEELGGQAFNLDFSVAQYPFLLPEQTEK